MGELQPVDDLAIRRLYAEYNHAIRLGDGTAWAECFTPDGVFSNRTETVSGRAALAAYADDFSKPRNARYWVDNLVLEATAGGASGTCYLLLLHIGGCGGPPRISLTGLYTDTLLKTSVGWKFATRHIARDV